MQEEVLEELRCVAREGDSSVSELLDNLVEDWLKKHRAANERAQARTRRRLTAVIGSIAGDDPERSEKVSETVRRRVAEKHGR